MTSETEINPWWPIYRREGRRAWATATAVAALVIQSREGASSFESHMNVCTRAKRLDDDELRSNICEEKLLRNSCIKLSGLNHGQFDDNSF